jgi:hypothetical protein
VSHHFFYPWTAAIFLTHSLFSIFPWLDRLPDILAPWRSVAQQRHQKELNVKVLVNTMVDIDIDKL